jgi:hypothetical protein
LESARASLELKKNENRQREKEVERIMEHESRIEEVRRLPWSLVLINEGSRIGVDRLW